MSFIKRQALATEVWPELHSLFLTRKYRSQKNHVMLSGIKTPEPACKLQLFYCCIYGIHGVLP